MYKPAVVTVLLLSLLLAMAGGFAAQAVAQARPGFPGGSELSDQQAVGILAALGVFLFVILLIALGVAILIIVLLSGCLKVLPQEYREMQPGMVWLLLIPLFNLVWMFFVYIRIPKSFQRYFAAQGRTEFGDCGEQLGLWTAICAVVSIIPIPVLNMLVSLASLVLLILFLVKVVGLKKYVKA